jgi:threonine dehydrogenase-like Zn-dependent dehydrogenase
VDLGATLIEHHGSAELLGMPLPGTDVYIEATGVGAVLQQAIDLARPRARLVVVSVHKDTIELSPLTLMMKELEIVGSMAYPDEFPQVLEMLLSGKVDVSPMVSHRFELDAFLDALATARNPEQAAKVMISTI